MSTVGNWLYFSVKSDPFLLVAARLLAGIGGANYWVGFAYLTSVSKRGLDRDSRIMAYNWITQVAQVVAPLVGLIGVSFSKYTLDITFNSYKIPPFILAILFTLTLLLQLYHFLFLPRLDSDYIYSMSIHDGSLYNYSGNSFLRRGTMVLLLMYFITLFSYWSVVAAIFPYSTQELGWSLSLAYAYFVVLGVIFAVAYALLKKLSNYIPDHKLLFVGQVSLGLGCILSGTALTSEISEFARNVQVYISAIFIGVGFSFGSNLCPKIFAHATGVQSENLGLRMGYWYGVAAAARGAGPLIGAFVEDQSGIKAVGLLAAYSIICGLTLMLSLSPQRDSQIIGEGFYSGPKGRAAHNPSLRRALLASE